MYFSYGDINSIEWMIDQKPSPSEQKVAKHQLQQVIDYAEGMDCRRTIQLGYFGETFAGNCGNCDRCQNPDPLEDWTIESQKLLSCVARCEQRFGLAHIIQVLRGSRNKKVKQHHHDELSTHGIGKDISVDQWRTLGRSLLNQGFMDATEDTYRILKLNTRSWQILRKQQEIKLPLPKQIEVDLVTTTVSQSPADGEQLFQQLRSLRKSIADMRSLAPYMVFPDSSLRQMAEKQPQTLTDFSQISGVGQRKLDAYGAQFIKVIQDHCASVAARQESSQSARNHRPPTVGDTHQETLRLYQQGLSLEDIAKARELKLQTITNHLAVLIEQGEPIDINRFVPVEDQGVIEKAIATIGGTALKPIREYLNNEYSYDAIRLVKAQLEVR